MCLICCLLWINATLSSPGVHLGPGDHHGTPRSSKGRRRIRGAKRSVRTDTEGVNPGGTVLTANPGGTDGVRAPTTNHRSTTTHHRPADDAIPAPAMRPYQVRTTDADCDGRKGPSPTKTYSTRDERGPLTGTGGYNPGHTAIWRGSPQFEVAVSECLDTGSQGGPSRSSGSGRQRSEISRLPGHFRVGSNSVEKLDCPIPDGNMS